MNHSMIGEITTEPKIFVERKCVIDDCPNYSIRDSTDDLCQTHTIEKHTEEWLDNTDPENLGIIKWAKYFLPHYMPQKTPEMHKQIYNLVLNLYDPFYKNKLERLLELISWRGSAKSTVVSMILPSYVLANNGKMMKIKREDGTIISAQLKENFIVIASETGNQAEEFIVRIRDEFTMNRRYHWYYKYIIEDAVGRIDGQWTRRAFKFNNCYVLGAGIGQQIRGKIKGPNRVSLLLVDDLYSENNTITKDSRGKVRTWWNAAAFNSVDDLLGKVVIMGTIVHEDTVLVDLENNPMWKTIKFALMPIEIFKQFVKEHLVYDENTATCVLPDDDIEEEFDRISKQRAFFEKLQNEVDYGITWIERADLYFIALKFKEAAINRMLSLFYQEYFHIIVSEENKLFKQKYFQKTGAWKLIKEFGHNWLWWPKMYTIDVDEGHQVKLQAINLQLGIDMATGQADGDDTSLTMKGRLPDGRRLTFFNKYGKWSPRDTIESAGPQDFRLQKVVKDRTFVKKIGWMDEAVRLYYEYGFETIRIGQGGEEKTLIDQCRDLFESLGIYEVQIFPRKQTRKTGDVIERVRNTLLNTYECMMEFHSEGCDKLEQQLEFLGALKNDDVADSAEVASIGLDEPMHSDYGYFVNEKKMVVNDKGRILRERVKEALNGGSRESPDWKTA